MTINSQVTAFGCCAAPSVVDAAVQNDSRADSRADGGVKDVAITASGTPLGFRQRCRVGVVIYLCGDSADATDLLGQRKIAPAGHIRRVNNHPGAGIQRTWRADADGLNVRVVARIRN